MKTLFFSIGIVMVAICGAQNISEPDGYVATENVRELGTSTRGIGNVKTFDNRYEGVKGTPFVFEDWFKGEVFLSDKQKIEVKALNYNCVDNEIVYRDPATKVIRILNRKEVDMFSIESPTGKMSFSRVGMKEGVDPVFAQLLYNQKSMVYKLYQKDFVRANYEGGYSADRKYDEFVDKFDIYFQKSNDDTLFKVKKSKKYIISCFPEKESEISDYFKKSKPDLKSEAALVELLRYYDSL